MSDLIPVLLSLVATPPAAPAAAPPAAPEPPKVTVTGQVRARAEAKREVDLNEDADSVATDGERVFLRSRITVQGDVSKHLRVVVQAQDSRLFGEEPTTAADTAGLDVHQAYFQAAGIGGIPLALHLGRMVLSYGDQRVLGGLEWSNVARSFDGLRVRGAAFDHLTVDLFWARLHADPDGARALGDDLLGLYAWWLQEGLTVDLYGFWLKDDGGQIDADGDGTAETNRLPGGGDLSLITLGARVDAAPTKGLHANAELAYQLGDRGALTVGAWAAHASLDYTLAAPMSPKLEVGYERASGDTDALDDDWGTFENLFPTNHMHYGFIDFSAWKNMQDIWAGFGATPVKGLKFLVRAHMLSRVDSGDTFYRASGAPLRPLAAATATDALAVGKELDVLVKWKAMPGLGVLAGWSFLVTDAFLDDTDANGDAPNPQFGYLQLAASF